MLDVRETAIRQKNRVLPSRALQSSGERVNKIITGGGRFSEVNNGSCDRVTGMGLGRATLNEVFREGFSEEVRRAASVG